MTKLLRIGEFATLNHLSIQTLRYYEKIGLLFPVKVDEQTHYRYYDLMQSAVLDMIQFLKSLDFSLEEIKEILSRQTNLDFLQSQLIEQQKELEQKQREVAMKLTQLADFRQATAVYQASHSLDDIEIIDLPPRNILTFSIPANIYTMTAEEYEYHLRRFRHYLARHFPFISATSRIGSVMKQPCIETEQLYANDLFVFYPTDLLEKGELPAQMACLAGGKYAIDYCDDFMKEGQAILAFKQKIASKGLTIAGDYVCEIIYEVPKLHQIERNMFIRMQVPVK